TVSSPTMSRLRLASTQDPGSAGRGRGSSQGRQARTSGCFVRYAAVPKNSGTQMKWTVRRGAASFFWRISEASARDLDLRGRAAGVVVRAPLGMIEMRGEHDLAPILRVRAADPCVDERECSGAERRIDGAAHANGARDHLRLQPRVLRRADLERAARLVELVGARPQPVVADHEWMLGPVGRI